MERIDSLTYFEHNAERFALRRKTSNKGEDVAAFLQEIKPNSRVLDWGCGAGIDLNFIARSGHRVMGLEHSPKMVELAKAESTSFASPLEPPTLIQKNGLFFTPTEHEFDGVWINESLNDLPSEQAQRVIALCFKGIKPNGVLGLIVQEGEGFYEDREDDFHGPSRFVYLYSEKSICSMLEQTGFQVMKIGRRKDKPNLMMIIAKATAKNS